LELQARALAGDDPLNKVHVEQSKAHAERRLNFRLQNAAL
jgi:hypothetical protein